MYGKKEQYLWNNFAQVLKRKRIHKNLYSAKNTAKNRAFRTETADYTRTITVHLEVRISRLGKNPKENYFTS
jgi:hypothetical protein